MNDEFKEEFIIIRVRVKKSLIEGILEMYLFRVYDFNSFWWVRFFPSFPRSTTSQRV